MFEDMILIIFLVLFKAPIFYLRTNRIAINFFSFKSGRIYLFLLFLSSYLSGLMPAILSFIILKILPIHISGVFAVNLNSLLMIIYTTSIILTIFNTIPFFNTDMQYMIGTYADPELIRIFAIVNRYYFFIIIPLIYFLIKTNILNNIITLAIRLI